MRETVPALHVPEELRTYEKTAPRRASDQPGRLVIMTAQGHEVERLERALHGPEVHHVVLLADLARDHIRSREQSESVFAESLHHGAIVEFSHDVGPHLGGPEPPVEDLAEGIARLGQEEGRTIQTARKARPISFDEHLRAIDADGAFPQQVAHGSRRHGRTRGCIREHGIDGVGFQTRQKPVRGVLLDDEPDRWTGQHRLEQHHRRGLGQTVGHTDRETLGVTGRSVVQCIEQFPTDCEDAFCVSIDHLSLGGQDESASLPDEQLGAERLLEQAQLTRHGRLGDVERPSSLPHASVMSDRPEIPQVVIVQLSHA